MIPYSARVSFCRLSEEESPFRFEKILWWQVSEDCVAVGEEDKAGGVEPDSVRGEGTLGELGTVGCLGGISGPQVRLGPPVTPTVKRNISKQ